MVITGNYAELVIPKVNFFKFASDIIKQQNDKIAMVDASTDRQLTFRNIHEASIKLASALTKRGLKKQEVVALCASNCIEYSLIILGIAACNAITTTCNPQYTLDETKKQFINCQPKFVITDADKVGKMLEIAKEVSSIQEIISVDLSSNCVWLWSLIEQDDGRNFPFHVTFDVDDDIVLLPYSSGTTGLPKGVMITHRNFVSSLVVLQGIAKVPPWLVLYTALPMFHIYGLLRLFGCVHGFKYVVDKRFQAKAFFEAVEKYKINYLVSVPAILMEISSHPLSQKYDLSSLSMLATGAAPLAPKVAVTAMQKMQAAVFQGWGLTECVICCTIAMINTPMNTVGFVAPNTILKVVDPETREELGVNENGELLIKSPQVMKGYYKNQAANASTFENGWLRTGDIGHYDQNGLVYITDRMKELIKYKGFQVAPAELESMLLEHPKIRDAGVVGVPDAAAGQVPRAFVVKEDASLTSADVLRFVESKVSSYKYIRGGVYFIDEIPRSVTGKILRRNLAKLPANQSKL